MEKGNISDYRRKLDETLASPDLRNHETIKTLVKDQISDSSHFQFEEHLENVVERRSAEVSNFLNMLRSASKTSGKDAHDGWNLKQDTQEFRVMYREGPKGTPFHTLLVEGYVDGPIDVCLCISCESNLYQKWWPQITIPTFKVMSSRCLQRVRTGENISLVRMKVSWPLSSREAIVHYFAFEYFQDDIVVVLLNSISDSEIISKSTHGFTRDGIPKAQDVVRIDVVGGFVYQKVTADRSYFRLIANMDIKLDFVPPSLINFISRQLLGSGFMLYKKEVASVTKGDEKYLEAFKDPFYSRLRKALYSENTSTEFMEQEDLKRSIKVEEKNNGEFEVSISENATVETNRIVKVAEKGIEALEVNISENIITETKGILNRDRKLTNEIEESEEACDVSHYSIKKSSDDSRSESKERATVEVVINNEPDQLFKKTTHEIIENSRFEENVSVSPEVGIAIGTLDKMISIFRETNRDNKKDPNIVTTSNPVKLKRGDAKESSSVEDDPMCMKNGNVTVPSETGPIETAPHKFVNGPSSHASRPREYSNTKDTNQSENPPAAPSDECHSDVEQVALRASIIQRNKSAAVKKAEDNYQYETPANNMNENKERKTRNKKSWYCCFRYIFNQSETK